jgi:AcrR family transcriptional regulator
MFSREWNRSMPKLTAGDKAPSRRQEASEQRRQAVLEAGLDVFATHGFAAARLDQVAAKAGVAKGTIYLFFRDKEDLFEQVVLGAVSPVLARLNSVASQTDLPVDALLAVLFEVFRNEILGTRRKEITRLIVSEGARFPKIAQFYHREVVSKAMELVRRVAARARTRGELASDGLETFPHLVFAPLLLSIIWDGLFSTIEPLDVEGLLAVHRAVLVGSGHRGKSP